MRLGISSDLDIKDAGMWARELYDIGCRSVVFPLDCTSDEESVMAYVNAAKQYDLTIAEVGIWRNVLASDPIEQKSAIDYSIGQLQLADRIGASCCVNISGSRGRRWDGADKLNFAEETKEMVIRTTQHIIDAADPKNTYFALEPMPWMLPDGPDSYLELIEKIDRKQFAVHMDMVNMINGASRYFNQDDFMSEVFEKLGAHIKSMHLKDIHLKEEYTILLEECALGLGEFHVEKYAELADSVNPELPVIIEHLPDAATYRKSLEYVRKRLCIS